MTTDAPARRSSANTRRGPQVFAVTNVYEGDDGDADRAWARLKPMLVHLALPRVRMLLAERLLERERQMGIPDFVQGDI